MGRELAIAWIPCANMTSTRIQTLHQIVDDLVIGELAFDEHYLYLLDEGEAECRTTLHKHVDIVAVAEDHWRDVNHIWCEEFPYTLLATAGDSWHGEPPSELFDVFQIIEGCEPLRKQLEEWARADTLQSSSTSP